MDARAIAADLAPRARALLESRKDELIGDLGWIERRAALAAWPHLMGRVPTILECGVELLADRYGKMTLDQVVTELVQVRQHATYVPKG